MSIKRKSTGEGAEYTVTYSDMRGVDLSADGIFSSRSRFALAENMYRDYEGDSSATVESIPGFRKILETGQKINGIYSHNDEYGNTHIVIHAGRLLYSVPLLEIDTPSSFRRLGSIENCEGRGFVSGTTLYIFLERSIVTVSGGGAMKTVGDATGDSNPYIPTTYINGVEYEQRNLLTNMFKEEYLITSGDMLSSETPGIKYKILSEVDMTCSVVGLESNHSERINVPAYKKLGAKYYKVYEIADTAFRGNSKLLHVTLAEGIVRIGKLAFADCHILQDCVCPSTVEIIDNAAFVNCFKMDYLYMGANLKKIGKNVFAFCTVLESINYGGDADSFALVTNHEEIGTRTMVYSVMPRHLIVQVPVFSPAKSISTVLLDGKSVFWSQVRTDGFVSAIEFSGGPGEFDGKRLSILGVLDDTSFTKNTVGSNFLEETEMKIKGFDAIRGCRVFTAFDGRIFLSGNPKIPNTVFYSARDNTGRNNPLYYGILNYFNDGIGNYPVISMLSSGDSLAIFKGGNDGDGSIYYHIPKETGEGILPKIYPVSYIHGGISALGESISFFDDPVFLSSLGLSALEKRSINLERSVVTRSYNVNPRLLSENLKNAHLAKWLGYLVIACRDNFYIADSRATYMHETGAMQYEWYCLSGIGSYKDDSTVYRYSSVSAEGYEISESFDEVCTDEVYSEETENGFFYFTYENGKKVRLEKTEELCGGSFFPATQIHSVDDRLLFFGTESGDICVFNNDKRGVPPPSVSEKEGFDASAYQKEMGRKIHPYFYSFAFHAPTYILKTVNDNGSIPNMTKNTVKHSLVMKVRTFGKGSVTLEAGTDRSGYSEVCRIPDASLDFGDLDFSSLAFKNSDCITIAAREKEKRWIDKQLTLYSKEYSSPIGLYSITYRFMIKGKIKTRQS